MFLCTYLILANDCAEESNLLVICAYGCLTGGRQMAAKKSAMITVTDPVE